MSTCLGASLDQGCKKQHRPCQYLIFPSRIKLGHQFLEHSELWWESRGVRLAPPFPRAGDPGHDKTRHA